MSESNKDQVVKRSGGGSPQYGRTDSGMVEARHEVADQPGCLAGITMKHVMNRGKFGKVYVAKDEAKQELVAVKAIPMYAAACESSVAREIDISMKAKHPAIIETYSLGRDQESTVYLVQELATGGDLYDHLREAGPCVAKDELVLKEFFRQLASALDYLHRELHVVHRDVKLENICIVPPAKGNGLSSVRMIDFGLAEYIEPDGSLRVAPGAVGTSMYIAPEAVALRHTGGTLKHAEKLDSFAVGVLLYALVTGNFPWDEASEYDPDYSDFAERFELGDGCAVFGIDPHELGISPHLQCLIHGLLHPDPAERLTMREAMELFINKPWYLPVQPLGFDMEAGTGQRLEPVGIVPSVVSGSIVI